MAELGGTAGMTPEQARTQSLMEQVREKMEVVDAAGKHIGHVEYVQMGDPEAVTDEGNELGEPGLIGQVGIALVGDRREPDVAGELRPTLLRVGFLKVGGGHLFGHDRYVRADQVTGVEGDRVTISAREGELADKA